MTDEMLIEVQELTKVYGNGIQLRALDGVSFGVRRGEMVAVMGPSGCGKSTLLNMLGALDRPTSGTVRVAGQDLSTVRDVDRFRARTVGFVFQLHNLIPTLTSLENIEIPLRGQPMSAAERRARAHELLELVGMGDRGRHVPSQLSGGQRQRVAVARALANRPELILADEPTGNLDSVSGEEIIQLLRDLNARHGTTLLLVTHDRHVARAMQRVLSMQDGRIIGDYRIADPLTEDLRELARSYLGERLVNGDVASLRGLPLVEGNQLSPAGQRLAEVLRGLSAVSSGA
jgi:ABC-type lipoprotein export system ATPase subunit